MRFDWQHAWRILGTLQAGLADFRLANLIRDVRLLIEARKEALAWLEKAPQLKSKESAGMREILKHRWGKRLQFGGGGVETKSFYIRKLAGFRPPKQLKAR